MSERTATQKEDLRHAVLEFLTTRHPTASPARAIRRTVAREVDWDVEAPEIEAACEMLQGLGLACFVWGELGNTRFWKATSDGVLAVERGL